MAEARKRCSTSAVVILERPGHTDAVTARLLLGERRVDLLVGHVVDLQAFEDLGGPQVGLDACVHFDDDDVMLGGEVITDPAEIVRANHWRDVAWHRAWLRETFVSR